MHLLGGEAGTSPPCVCPPPSWQRCPWGGGSLHAECLPHPTGPWLPYKSRGSSSPSLGSGCLGSPPLPLSPWLAAGPGRRGQDWVKGKGWSFSYPVPWTRWWCGSAPGGWGHSSPLAAKGTSMAHVGAQAGPSWARASWDWGAAGWGQTGALGEAWPGVMGHHGSSPHFWMGGNPGLWFFYL